MWGKYWETDAVDLFFTSKGPIFVFTTSSQPSKHPLSATPPHNPCTTGEPCFEPCDPLALRPPHLFIRAGPFRFVLTAPIDYSYPPHSL